MILGGLYHGKLVFPSEFPFKPPSIYMTTPNGRFKTDTRLCLSISDYHPDTWNPAWSVATILTGLLSFMLEKSPTLGSVESSGYDKRQFAIKSHEFNLKSKVFCELFPDMTKISKEFIDKRNEALAASAAKRNGSLDDDPLAMSRRQLERNGNQGFSVQGASLDDHAIWISRLSGMASSMIAAAIAVVLLILAAMVLVPALLLWLI